MRHTETVIQRYGRLMLLAGIMIWSATSSFPQGASQAGAQNGTIAGRILSLDGTPAANVRVAASAVPDNPMQNADGALLSIAQTDSAGRYRLENVPPGRYYISAGQVEAPTYFPGVATLASATVLTVRSGAVVEDYDFRVVVPLPLRITGHVVRQDNGSNANDEVWLDLGPNKDLFSSISPGGSFEFSNVPPGKYEIEVEGKMPPVKIVLVDKDITGLQLVVPAEVTVTGTVTIQGDILQPSFGLRFTNTAGWVRAFAVGVSAVSSGSGFTASLFPAEWRVEVTAASGLPAGYLIKSMTDGATDLLRQTLKVAAGGSPEIMVTLGISSSPPGGKVSGQVTGHSAASTSPRTVRLGSRAFINTLSAPVNPDGFFEFPMVLPGTYFIDTGSFSTKIVVGDTDLKNLAIAAPDLKDVTGEFVSIPPGEFMMGCSPGDNACADDEKPTHRVRITKGFEMGRFEVTQALWEPVMGMTAPTTIRPDLPMTLNWNQAQEFVRRLNALQDDYLYRLPTEAEWEHAARAGTTGAHPGELDDIAWHLGNSGGIVHPGGQKLPNAWGLYDMLGNVSEWTQDLWATDFCANSPANDPAGPIAPKDLQSPTAADTATRVQRGGAWNRQGDPAKVRVSNRQALPPGGGPFNGPQIGAGMVSGFRLVREVIP
jgi:formylglycine-generating enzyme required for sulfatase activity